MRLAKASPRLLPFLVLGLTGCFSLAKHPAPPSPFIGEPDADGIRRLHHEVIAEESRSPVGEAAFTIHDQERWSSLRPSLRIDWDDEPDIDRNTVIYVSISAGSGGYRVRVDSVFVEGGLISAPGTRLVGGEVVVAYTVEEPGDDCMATMMTTTPYQAVVVGIAFDHDPVFLESREPYSCAGHR